jgi:hypothetical protein
MERDTLEDICLHGSVLKGLGNMGQLDHGESPEKR